MTIDPVHIIPGDVITGLRTLPDACVHCVVTSPPYWGLRDYGVDGQIGLEPTPAEYLDRMVAVFREVRRVLRPDGTCWVNMGDGYSQGNKGAACGIDEKQPARRFGVRPSENGGSGLDAKQLIGMPWRLAFALQSDGWWLRSDIIWAKPNPMPESVTDRPTKSHEYVFLLTKSERYFYDAEAIKEVGTNQAPGNIRPVKGAGMEGHETRGNLHAIAPAASRNARTVWTIPTQAFSGWTKTSRLVPVAADAASDGMMRITSEDCPVHAGCPDRVPKAFRDAHGADALIRSLGSADRLAQAREVDCVPTPPRHGPGSNPQSLDSQDQPCSPTANSHSTRSSRTAHVPETTSPCSASVQSLVHTGGNGVAHEPSDLVGRTPASSSVVGSASHGPGSSSDRTTDHNGCRCTCQYYSTENREMSHFATFPEALPERCIKAGCPAGGTVLDPFLGSGTTIAVARQLGRNGIGCELNPAYIELARERIGKAERPNTYRSDRAEPAPLFGVEA